MLQKDLAKALGLSAGRVSQLKKDGMPVNDVAAAQGWLAAHSSEGIGHKSAAASPESGAAFAAPIAPSGGLDAVPDDAAGTLHRMRDVEQRAYAQISAALEKAKKSESAMDYAALQPLIRSYNAAATNSLAAAQAWEKHCRAAGEVAPIEHLKNVLTSVLEPLAAQLTNLPALLAAKANPAAPAVAESAIAAELEQVRRQIAAALVAPIPPAPSA
jgi:hypothetical protein